MSHSNHTIIDETLVESESESKLRLESEQGRQTDDFLARVVETIQETMSQQEEERRKREENRRQEEPQRRRAATEESSPRPQEERARARFNRD